MGAVGPREFPSLNNPAKHAQRRQAGGHRWVASGTVTGRMVALNVRCYVAVAVQADRLVNSRLQGSERALFYFSSLPPRSGGDGVGQTEWTGSPLGGRKVQPGSTLVPATQNHMASAWPEALAPCSDHMGPFPGHACLEGSLAELLGRPSAGWLMELLPQAPGGRAKKEMGIFSVSGSLGGPKGR